MTKIDERIASPLVRSLVGEADPAWAREQDGLVARRDAAQVTAASLLSACSAAPEAANWIEVTRLANELARLSKSETARKNRIGKKKSPEKARKDWIKSTGIDPVKFYALSALLHETATNRYRKWDISIDCALMALRPELSFRPGLFKSGASVPPRYARPTGTQARQKAAEDRKAIVRKLKSAAAYKKGPLSALFEKIDADLAKLCIS